MGIGYELERGIRKGKRIKRRTEREKGMRKKRENERIKVDREWETKNGKVETARGEWGWEIGKETAAGQGKEEEK